MASLRFKSKRIKDEKEYKQRQVELKRYLDSFPKERRNDAQLLMSRIYRLEQRINRMGYASFFLLSIAIGAYALGLWDTAAGKAISIASGGAFAVVLLYVVVLAYKNHELKLALGRLRITSIAEKNRT